MENWQNLRLSDSTEMGLYIVRPETPAKASIMVFQEIFGVNKHIRDVTARFAQLGFLAVAPDLFHRSEPHFTEENYNNKEKAQSYGKAYTSAHMAIDIEGAYQWLKKESGHDNISATGYCLGGKVAFLANALFPLKAAISYYGNLGSIIEQSKNQHGPLLMCWGGKDDHLGMDMPYNIAKELKSAGKVFTNTLFSEAKHGFFCDQREAYDEVSARQSWELVKIFLKENI